MFESSLEGHLHRGCGGRYGRAVEPVTLKVSGMSATVERAVFRCAKCGDEQYTVEQRDAAEQTAVTAVRRAHGLMTPKEIRQMRERLGLTPQQLGDLLYGTPGRIVEGWERGRYVQNPRVDALLRSLQDPATLERRAAKAGVTLKTPEASTSTGEGDGAAMNAATNAATDATPAAEPAPEPTAAG
jgi:putative zinc finger/helix-turn-helix YgiT family protein